MHGSFLAVRFVILICFVFMAQRSWMIDDCGEDMRAAHIRAMRWRGCGNAGDSATTVVPCRRGLGRAEESNLESTPAI
jgi:hypothetical protein